MDSKMIFVLIQGVPHNPPSVIVGVSALDENDAWEKLIQTNEFQEQFNEYYDEEEMEISVATAKQMVNGSEEYDCPLVFQKVPMY